MKRPLLVPWALAALALGWPAAASASCIPQTPQQQRDAAAVIFVGVALEGPTASGAQRFRVERYEKGAGPQVRLVSTGVVARTDGTGSTTSVSIEAAAGERWRIFGVQGSRGALDTNVCLGSTKLADASPAGAGAEATPFADSATAAGDGGAWDYRRVTVAALVLGLVFATLVLARSRRMRHAGD